MELITCNCGVYTNNVFTLYYSTTQYACQTQTVITEIETQIPTAITKTIVSTPTPALETETITVSPLPQPNGKWFLAPYKDVTQNMNWNTYEMGPKAILDTLDNITLAFATGKCGEETWAGIKPENIYYPKPFILSTGGANGKFSCMTDLGFATFLESYKNMSGIDFDLELDQSPQEIEQLLLRLEKYPTLRKSFTLATLGGNAANNLNNLGQMVMEKLMASKVTNWYINLMTMNYGSPNPTVCTVTNGKCDMYKSAVRAVESLKSFYNLPYNQIEVTPMLGINDVVTETFTTDDAHNLAKYATQVGLASIHYWSLDRDKDYVYTNIFKQYV